MYELYEKFMEACKSNDSDAIALAGQNWFFKAEENPFEVNTPEYELFFKAKLNYTRWKSGIISSRRSRVVMMECIAQIGALNIPNPYKQEVVEEPVAAEEVKVEQPEVVHVLGVVPEETKEEPEVKEPVVENHPEPEEKIEEEPAVEIKKESVKGPKKAAREIDKRQLFGKKK